jgi:HK97 family phage major capsid protein
VTLIDIASLRGLDAYRAADADLRARLAEIDAEAEGQPFTEEQRLEFEEISAPDTGLLARVGATIEELEIRERAITSAMNEGARRNDVAGGSSTFNAPNVRRTPDNVFDLAAYRSRANSLDELPAAYREGALRVLEQASFPSAVDQDATRARIATLIEKHKDDEHGVVSRRIIGTSAPAYVEAWGAYMKGGHQAVPQRLQAALQTYSDADGGFAIPFTIDPTFVLTTDGAVNPLRTMARVETITTKSWTPITTAGVTASYALETAAAADAAPSDVDDPSITPIRAHVAVDFTAEYAEDYGAAAIVSEVGRLVADAKNVLEANKFVLGTGVNEPDGIVARLITEASSLVASAAVNTFALVDVDAVEADLGERFLSDAQWLAARKIYRTIRGFGTAGAPANSIYDQVSGTLGGYPARITSAMDKTTTTGSEPLLLGSFRHFVIVDRLGLSTEYIPQIFDGNGRPLGRRGVYARWRNDTGILTVNAFRLLQIA